MSQLQRQPESGPVEPYTTHSPAVPREVPASRARMVRWAGFAPALFFLVIVMLPPLNHDAAAVLDFSRRWLAGERLYIDLIDVNPPLIFILNLVPAALARWTPLGPAQALVLCLLGVAGLVWWLCASLRVRETEGEVEAAVLTTCLPLLLVMAGSDFGQRDVLMAMAAIPYCLLAARRIEGPPAPGRLAIGVVVLAALAFALKPYFLMVPLMVEGLVGWRRGFARAARDPVPWLMAMVWFAYLLLVLAAFPAFYQKVLPFAWEVYGGIHGPGPWRVLVTDMMGAATFLLLVAVVAAMRWQAGAFAQALAVAACGAFFSAWMQHKGWPYHVIPVTILACGAVVFAAARWVDRMLPHASAYAVAPVLAAVASIAILLYTVHGSETPWREAEYADGTADRLATWLRQQAGGSDVLVLSPDIFPVQPALTYAGARQRLRPMSTWMLQATYRHCPDGASPYHELEQMGQAERSFFLRTAEDFAAAPPRALVVQRDAKIHDCGARFDLLDYFLRSPSFLHAFRNYRPAGEIDGYRLFLRQP
ncbi:hypothetical protein [Neoroseomonas lacus]|uniref:Uncharacterized protein n=1 Tax=Neoroseomonas lacus TaxID=287609 RepID=A0A917K507_9PROT|nr:hypothetical protein [Neoroseomonas lacus]GGJ01274.1 hypothetical protein GCM10011320_05080 [Neoroseomonas lacus]